MTRSRSASYKDLAPSFDMTRPRSALHENSAIRVRTIDQHVLLLLLLGFWSIIITVAAIITVALLC